MPTQLALFKQINHYPYAQWLGVTWSGTILFFQELEGYLFGGEGRSLIEALATQAPLYASGRLNRIFQSTGADFLQ